METRAIQQALEEALPLEELQLTSSGDHLHLVAVSPLFEGLSRVSQQRMVYEPLAPFFAENMIHSITIRAFSPAEWQKVRPLYPS